jgi:urease accessory protein
MAYSEWTIWQLVDGSFPSGGFAHSSGMEAAWKQGEVADAAALGSFIQASLAQAGRGSLPFVGAAYDEPERFARIDAHQDAALTNHVARRASRAQGRGLLSAAIASFPETDFNSLETPCRTHGSPGHLAPVFGGVLRALQQTRAQAANAFVYTYLRGIVSAAVRLGIVGPLEGQRMTARYGPDAQRLAEACRDLTPDDVTQTAPVLELYQAGHDRLYSRLFQS